MVYSLRGPAYPDESRAAAICVMFGNVSFVLLPAAFIGLAILRRWLTLSLAGAWVLYIAARAVWEVVTTEHCDLFYLVTMGAAVSLAGVLVIGMASYAVLFARRLQAKFTKPRR